MIHRKRRDGRDGYVLVLVAMLLFGIMAMAALVIDIGFARLAQRQMQTAADSAALEGLRGEGDSTMTYEMRQEAAEQLIAWTFDDDLDAGNGDDGIAGDGGQFGAGPLVQFADGVGDPAIEASQLMTVDPDNTTHKPTMQRAAETTGEFSISIQRGLGGDNTASLFSQGPSVPFLFARGSLINRGLVARGISVGALSIANRRSAVRVGPSQGSVPGIQAAAFEFTDWTTARANPMSITTDVSDGLSIGQQISLGGLAAPNTSDYCAIYLSGNNRVIGFGCLGHTDALGQVVSAVATQNATARLSEAWVSLGPLGVNERNAIISTNELLEPALKAPVLKAHVLVRN